MTLIPGYDVLTNAVHRIKKKIRQINLAEGTKKKKKNLCFQMRDFCVCFIQLPPEAIIHLHKQSESHMNMKYHYKL